MEQVKKFILASDYFPDQGTIDPCFYLYDTPHKKMYISYHEPLTDYDHLIITTVNVHISPSGSMFWSVFFWSLVVYC